MRSPREVPASGVRRLRSKIRLGGRLNAVRDAARVLVLRDSANAEEGRREAPLAREGAYAAPVRVREPSPGVWVGCVSRRVSDGGRAARGESVRGAGFRRAAAPAEFRLGGRLNAVRDAARLLVLRDSAIAGEGRRRALLAQEGAYAAPARVREPSPGVGVGCVSRRVSDGGRAARGESVRGRGLRHAAVPAEFRVGGRRIAVRDAARIIVRCDSLVEERSRGALLAQEGAYAAPARVREPSPGLGSVVCPGAFPMAVRPPVGSP